ncbi:hypothetical protein [Streptomyces sp. NPDC012746]|uniref:hypothetical protein n=1 Tax=Streptomyces sp. NPDC012746 TaxID=3364845 RepID=UPI0036C434E1
MVTQPASIGPVRQPVSNRLHGLLTQLHPSPEQVMPAPQLQPPAVLALLERFRSPDQPQSLLAAPGHPDAAEGPDVSSPCWTNRRAGAHTEAAVLIAASLAASLTAALFGVEPEPGAVYFVMPDREAWFANSGVAVWLDVLHCYGSRVTASELLSEPKGLEEYLSEEEDRHAGPTTEVVFLWGL